MNEQHLHHGEQQDGFIVPENYFAESRKQLLHRVNNSGFTVPEAYFEKTKAHLLKQTKNVQVPTRVIAIRSLWYAAAAAVAVVSSFLFLSPKPVQKPDFSKVSNEEIVNYVLTSESIADIPVGELYATDASLVTREDEEIVSQIDEEVLLNEL